MGGLWRSGQCGANDRKQVRDITTFLTLAPHWLSLRADGLKLAHQLDMVTYALLYQHRRSAV